MFLLMYYLFLLHLTLSLSAFGICLFLYINLLPTICRYIHLLRIVDSHRHTVAPKVSHLTHSAKGKAARSRPRSDATKIILSPMIVFADCFRLNR